MSDLRWEAVFVAVSAILGESIDDTMARLDERAAANAGELVRALGAPSREVRVRALARAVSQAATAIDDARLA